MAHALADRGHEEEVHGWETGRIVMNPQGGYTEIHEPARRVPGLAGARRGALPEDDRGSRGGS